MQDAPRPSSADQVAETPAEALHREEFRRKALENEKLELELAALRRWWIPYLPAALTAVAVIVGFITAWKVGVFEARTHYLRAETARLETRLTQLDRELKVAPVQALTERIEAVPDVTLGAIDELIAYLVKLGQDLPAAVEFLSAAVHEAQSDTAAGILLYCLYHGTSDSMWRDRLFEWTRRNVSNLDRQAQERALAVFGQQRWSAEDRTHVSRFLVDFARTHRVNHLAAVSLYQLGALHKNAWRMRLPSGFRLFETDAASFFDAIVLARDTALNGGAERRDRSYALSALAQLAPPAFMATSVAVFENDPDGERDFYGFRGVALSGALVANEAMAYRLSRAPLPPRGETQYDDSSVGHWLAWKNENRDAFDLWMEPELRTLRDTPKLYRDMLLVYEDPYG